MEKISQNLINRIPEEVSYVTSALKKAGFQSYLVGGCVRDLMIGRDPKDWDVTTNAKPEQIIGLFEKTVYENNFGTVAVCLPARSDAEEGLPIVSGETEKGDVSRDTYNDKVTYETTLDHTGQQKYFIVEVTPYRIETQYTDFRHPDEVKFSDTIEDDLKRRDFTVNAMALDSKGFIKDIYKGQQDLKDKILRTVGNPDDRFGEDALRMLRAVRFACQLGFSVSHETTESIINNAKLIENISNERIRDEFAKIIESDNPAMGLVMLQKFGLLQYMIPELLEGVGCEQGGAHLFDVWEHLLHALQHAADKKWPLEIRLAALFHDIGKPRTRRGTVSKTVFDRFQKRPSLTRKYTFYGHEVVGARMVGKIMQRLKFPVKQTELVEKLVRNHMFFSDTEQITLSAVRRIISKVSPENIWDLMNVRECDRVGMKKKEAPYRLRKYFAMIEEALHDPISVKQLKIDGNYLMNTLHMKPGPRMGWVLNALLEEVLDDASKNTEEYLSGRVKELELLSDEELKKLGEQGKEKKDEIEGEVVESFHTKHGVKK